MNTIQIPDFFLNPSVKEMEDAYEAGWSMLPYEWTTKNALDAHGLWGAVEYRVRLWAPLDPRVKPGFDFISENAPFRPYEKVQVAAGPRRAGVAPQPHSGTVAVDQSAAQMGQVAVTMDLGGGGAETTTKQVRCSRNPKRV